MKKKAGIRGTREWAVAEINCSKGCPHGCLYCYARYDQVERKGLVSAKEWPHCANLEGETAKKYPLYDGQVMFPAAHDIVPENLERCIDTIRRLIEAGNRVLVVSKPHLECIKRLCREFYAERNQILFRFTITARDPDILRFWESGAPDYQERLSALRFCHEKGFATSVSVEPMLHRGDVVEMVHELLAYVTHSIWIGKMNKIEKRVNVQGDSRIESEVDRIVEDQSDENLHQLYDILKNVKKVRWKESIKEVLGLELPQRPGLDL